MRARIERAAHAEQHTLAEQHFHKRVKESLESLVSAVQAVPQAWAVSPVTFSESEKSDDLSYWTKPELPRVVSSLCEIERLVKERVAETLKATDAESLLDPQNETKAKETSQIELYAALVGHVVTEFIAPVTNAYELTFTATFSEISNEQDSKTVVQVQFPNNANELFPSDCTLLLPVCVYVGWRCCFRLLDAFRRLLSVREDDGVAGWLDVASAQLDSLNRAAHSLARALVLFEDNIGRHQAVAHFKQRTKVCGQLAHLYWWWWGFTQAFGSAHGWTQPVSAAAEHSSNCVDFMQLLCTGCTCATRFLSAVVLPSAVRVLELSISELVFQGNYTNTRSVLAITPAVVERGNAAAGTRVQLFVDAIIAVQQCALSLFPQMEESNGEARNIITMGDLETHPRERHRASFSINDNAAAMEFVRLAVHDALRPFAERVLDDPSLLLARLPTVAAFETTSTDNPSSTHFYNNTTAVGAASSPAKAVPSKAAVISSNGWEDSEEDECDESEKVRVLDNTNGSFSPNMSAQHLDTERDSPARTPQPPLSSPHPASAEGRAVVAAAATVTCVRDALIFMLDTLEARCGPETVRQDSIAMTLRRLL